ncbi:hypothetical protein GCM10023149_05240 [Mucilaginibacter gynuensis]|uniref:Uncharacterized protein n=1 Tax=Mucilaginibacter gynuensis TaxID=1302236 RepID=A0ABP8FTN4_9SPHI
MVSFFSKSLLYCYIFLGITAFKAPSKANFHPLHVSTTDISYNKDDGKFEVICTIFTDDFEAALAKQYHTKTDLSKESMHAAMDELVKKYVADHLQIKTSATPLKLTYIGFEKANEAVNIYLESDKTTAIKKVDADVSLLHNLYDDQMNIVHITVNGARKSTKLDYPNRKVSQTF